MIQEVLLYLVVLAAAFFSGWLLAWLCNDELVNDRRWLYAIGALCAVLGFFFLAFYRDILAIPFSLFFMLISVSVMIYLSYNKKFVKI